MKNITKTTKTILFASLIAAMILPFSGMDFAEAEKQDKKGKDIIKNYKASEAMPKFKDVKEKHKDKSEQVQREEHQKEHKKWLVDNLDEATETIVREKQDLFTTFVTENYQEWDPSEDNYFPWTSIGYDYEDNALEVTILPAEFNKKDLKEYYEIIRSVVGNEIDVTISPMNAYELVSCNSRTDCDDLEAGVEIGMNNKNFPCTLGFKATYNGKNGFVTAGHCFDGETGGGNSVGNDTYHPENGSHIGDLEEEIIVSRPPSTRCDCAFVEASGISNETYGISTSATSTGTSPTDKTIKASLGQSNTVTSGVITDNSRTVSSTDYRLLGVVETDIAVISGDSGSPVFSSDGSEFLGIMVAKNPDDPSNGSVYVRADKFTTYLSGLTWGF